MLELLYPFQTLNDDSFNDKLRFRKRQKFNSRTLIFKSKFVQKVKNQWTGNDHRVATLPKSYLTVIG